MTEIWAFLPGALFLLLLSGFFSGSEAAFFSLSPNQRRQLARGSPSDQLASTLLMRSERLLMAILLWNLAINLAYFSLASKASQRLAEESSSDSAAVLVTLGALLAIVVFGEFLPKSLAVTYPLSIVRMIAVPLTVATRLVEWFLPIISLVNEASRRLVWPGFQSEPYLELADLDRAVELSTEDAELYEQESDVLRNVIRLREIRVEEWMRPRNQHLSFQPPLSLEQLGGQKPPSGYILVTDLEGRDVTSYIDLDTIGQTQSQNLNALRQPLVVVPWCATIADALADLKNNGRRVALVVNEFGESIGILTWEEIMEAILQSNASASHGELAKAELQADTDGSWVASGTTKLRRLERALGCRFTSGRGLTIGGVLQESLHRLPEQGDELEYEGWLLTVLQASELGEVLIRVRPVATEEQDP